ncbi:MAG: ABC-type transport system ATPase component, partial [Bacteroidetes bacterium]|nr:ABC-type transport system ATPase component [Bacteroidota bacterium]
MSSAIETKDLSRSFGDIKAVDRISLTINEGEMFGLVGPDGSGKTTTIRMLCGILAPTSGSATVLGHDIIKQSEKVKKEIGYLSQRFSLYGDLSIDENIEFFAEINKVYDFKQQREELLDFTRLKPFRDRLAERLSGGMKQKLALACTLIHTPKVILLDEPTTGVDPVSRRDFWKILQSLIKQGITIVM